MITTRPPPAPAAPGAVSPLAADALHDLAWLDAAGVLTSLHSAAEGLGALEVDRRRQQFGRNDIAHEKAMPWYWQFTRAFANPFNILLTVLALVSGVTGDRRAVIVIALMVALSTVLRFVQEFRSTAAAAALRALVTNRTSVKRRDDPADPAAGGIRGREVPLAELVPGDIVFLAAGDMVPADVRVLTAKDLFVSQSSLTGEALPTEKSDHAIKPAGVVAMSDLPTICFMGTTVVSGSATGVVCATGSATAFGTLAKGLVGQHVATAFDVGVSKVSWLFIRFTLVMVPIVIVLNGMSHHIWLEACLFGLAIAVGLTPEMLPMVVTTNLAKGAVTMARQKTIVKRLSAIQNFGAMDLLCTDKTGTLTQDRIALERYINASGNEDPRVLALAYLNSYYQTGLKNLLDVAVLAHSELDAALALDQAYGKVDEIPFDFSRRRMSVIVDHQEAHHQLICKGAVEEVLAACTTVRDGDAIAPLDPERAQGVTNVATGLNAAGLRVVAVAYRDFDRQHGPYTVADESGLVLAGFVSFLDPPKESAGPALRALAGHGVAVKILTGDNELVSRKVCADVGLAIDRIVLGSDLTGMNDAQLGELADRTVVFAKLTPDDKIRIVAALRARGHTVGYMGDGINDAGALRAADVGISVDSAVDIAKESADIILLDKSLMVLDQGVIEGRKTFGNTIKYIKMTASSNFGTVLSVLIASVFLPFLPMLPIQLLTLNLLYDLSQTSIPWDDMDPEYLTVPRKWRADDIGRFMLCIGPVSSLFDMAVFIIMWQVFKANAPARQSLFQTGWFVESLITQVLIVHLIRTAKIPFLQSRATWPVLALTATIMLGGLALPFLSLGRALGLQSLPAAYFAWLAAMVLGYLVLAQLSKTVYIRHFGTWL